MHHDTFSVQSVDCILYSLGLDKVFCVCNIALLFFIPLESAWTSLV